MVEIRGLKFTHYAQKDNFPVLAELRDDEDWLLDGLKVKGGKYSGHHGHSGGYGGAGNPGGSRPSGGLAGGAGVPRAPEMGKPIKIGEFTSIGSKKHQKCVRYGQVVYAPSRVGGLTYARLYHYGTGKLMASFTKAPISGHIKKVKKAASKIAKITNWDVVEDLSMKQQQAIVSRVNDVIFPLRSEMWG